MIKELVQPSDPILLKIAEPILESEVTSTNTQALIERMLNVAYGEQVDRNKPLLVGLAAPQIGISKRIILVDIAARGKGNVGDLRVYINPEIIWKSDDLMEWYEGCYSTDQVCGIVSRPNSIKLKALNKEGQPIEEDYDGYTARIFQHEIDHLNGTEFVSHITGDDKLHWVEDDEFPEYRDNEGWRNWPHRCSREKWEKIKGISTSP